MKSTCWRRRRRNKISTINIGKIKRMMCVKKICARYISKEWNSLGFCSHQKNFFVVVDWMWRIEFFGKMGKLNEFKYKKIEAKATTTVSLSSIFYICKTIRILLLIHFPFNILFIFHLFSFLVSCFLSLSCSYFYGTFSTFCNVFAIE